MKHDAPRPRNGVRFYERLVIGPDRKALLESHAWCRNVLGGWVHPHCMDLMSRQEILALTPAQLDYKLRHGSRAMLPPELAYRK